MKEFIEKLIGRLEEKIVNLTFDESIKTKNYAYKNAIEIVNELAEEYQSRVMIDNEYCWQKCSAVEHCKECSRLGNGTIDYFENYDSLAEEYNNGWIPCSERLPEEKGEYLVTLKTGVVTSAIYDSNENKWVDAIEEYFEYPCIAWQPLPQSYKPQKLKWKDKVMKHFTKVE